MDGRLAAGSDGGDGRERTGGLLARAVQGPEAARHQAAEGEDGRLDDPTAVERRPAAVLRTPQLVHEPFGARQLREHATTHHRHPGPHERVQGEQCSRHSLKLSLRNAMICFVN